MDIALSSIEARVIGSLIEKELTTPEYYPLTLNALTNACNQKNNRDPILSLEETTVVRAIESLREKGLLATVTGAGIRVPKYRQVFSETLVLASPEVAVVALLMLRGPQTIGEIRGRCASMHAFESLEAVQSVVDVLSTNEQRIPLVKKLPRQAGQKEVRFMHLLSGEPASSKIENSAQPEKARLVVVAENERITSLEAEVKRLKDGFETLREQFGKFKKQFE